VDHFPDFVCQQRDGLTIWVNRGLISDELLDRLKNPDVLFGRPGTQVIKDQRKIKVARAIVSVAGRPGVIYVKRFNAFSWRYRLGSLMLSSGAVRALRGAHVLSQQNIPAARAVAAVECRSCGMLTKSFFLTEEIAGGKTVDTYWRQDLQSAGGSTGHARRRDFLRRLAALFRRLHNLNIYHNDLKDANILVVPRSDLQPESIFLLDLEGIRRYRKLNRRRRIKNLVQLNRTLGRFLRRGEKYLFLKYYGEGQFADRTETARRAMEIDRRSIRLDRRKLRKAVWQISQKNG
jgi:tRNA A-37 threonylcarbamoyl transferase component Bud32